MTWPLMVAHLAFAFSSALEGMHSPRTVAIASALWRRVRIGRISSHEAAEGLIYRTVVTAGHAACHCWLRRRVGRDPARRPNTKTARRPLPQLPGVERYPICEPHCRTSHRPTPAPPERSHRS